MSDNRKGPDPESGRQSYEDLTEEELTRILRKYLREDPDRYRERMDRLWQNISKKLDEPEI